MREIKFRLWNNAGKKSKIFYDVDQVFECLKQQSLFNDENHRFNKLGYNHIVEGSSFMQYTGLKDKNGKEIYEGDIVKINGADRIYYIRWFDDMCFAFADIRSDYVNTFYECYNTHNNGFPCDTHIEVIGNIYENPELIK